MILHQVRCWTSALGGPPEFDGGVTATYLFAEADRAMAEFAGGHTTGRVVITF